MEKVHDYSNGVSEELRQAAIEELERREKAERQEASYNQSGDVSDELRQAAIEELERREQLEKAEAPLPAHSGDYSVGERLGQFLRGIAGTYGGIADLASSDTGHPTMMGNLSSNYSPAERIQGKPLSEELPKAVDNIYGSNLSPTDTTGRFSQGVGEFMAPLPIPGGAGYVGAAKSGIKGLAKHFGKEAVISSGASGAVNLTPKMAKEGTLTGAAEDIAKSLVGAKASRMALGVKPGKMLSKGFSKFVEPNEEILKTAHKHDISVPFNVASNSKVAHHVANNYLKSMYVSKQYKDSLRNADSSMMNAVKKSIDTLGESNQKPTEASVAYRTHVKDQEKVFKKRADELYLKARENLNPSDQVTPKNTIEALNSQAAKELLDSISPSASEKSVINRINEIKNKISGENKISNSDLKRYKDNPKFLQLLKSKDKKEIPVSELVGLRKSLMNTLNYEPDIRGSKAYLSRLVKTLDSDIKTTPNKDFLEKYETANSFFKKEIGERFRISVAQGIMKHNSPREAYDLLNSVDNIKIIEKIVGQEQKGKEIFNSLKKAKVRDIIGNVIQGDLDDGTLRTAGFAKLFQKGEKRQEILEALLGKKEYSNLAEIAEVAEEFSKSGRELLNTSGTAHVLSDMNAAKDVVHEVKQTLKWLTGGAVVGFSVAGIPGAVATSFGAPYMISRLVSNPKFVSQMRSYALARKRGQDKYADTLMRRIIPGIVKEAKLVPAVVKEVNRNKSSQEEQNGSMYHD